MLISSRFLAKVDIVEICSSKRRQIAESRENGRDDLRSSRIVAKEMLLDSMRTDVTV